MHNVNIKGNKLLGMYYNYYFICVAHVCDFDGCKNVLVIDGNMKNRHDVCAATEAGFIEYEGLPGVIKTGCQLSPGYQSKYCYHHAPRVTRAGNNDTEEDIIKLITGKKTTRNGTYYQVY